MPGVHFGQNHSIRDLEYTDDVRTLSDPEKANTMVDDVVTCANVIGLNVSTTKKKIRALSHTDRLLLTFMNRISSSFMNRITPLL